MFHPQRQPVCDYRTETTGLQAHHLTEGTLQLHQRCVDRNDRTRLPLLVPAPVFIEVQRQVASIIRDKILVGYALWEFLSVRHGRHPGGSWDIYNRSILGNGPRTSSYQHTRYRPLHVLPSDTRLPAERRSPPRHAGEALHGERHWGAR